MRDNFDVYEWNIQKIREEKNISGDEAVTKTIEFLRKSIYPKLTDDEMDKFVVGICEFMDCTPPAYRLSENLTYKEPKGIDKVAGGIPYTREGNKFIISMDLPDDVKERIIKRAEENGYDALPNMTGGVTIMAKDRINEDEGAFVVTAKKDGEPDASFAYADEDMAKKFKVELDKDGYTTTISRKKVDGVAESVNEDKGTLNKIADVLSRKFDDLDFNINTTSDRIDVRGSQQDLFNFGDKLHGKKMFDYEVFATDDDDRGEIVRIVKSDSISKG